jgi:hypothetical protein
MTIDLATRLGNTFISAVTPPMPAMPYTATVRQSGLWRRLARAVFQAPGRVMAHLERRQAERDALLRYAMSEGRELGLGRSEVERAVLLTGRADMLFPSYFVNAHRR